MHDLKSSTAAYMKPSLLQNSWPEVVRLSLQLANAERRMAKRRTGGSFARARAFYRASVEALEVASAGKQSEAADDNAEQNSESKNEGETERRDQSERYRVQHVRLSDKEQRDGDLRRSLGRALRSWARMEGYLG